MIKPIAILEDKDVIEFLQSRNILKQYQKAKILILSGITGGTNFGEKQPKGSNIRYFRVNRKYRAIGSFDINGKLKIFDIEDHQ